MRGRGRGRVSRGGVVALGPIREGGRSWAVGREEERAGLRKSWAEPGCGLGWVGQCL